MLPSDSLNELGTVTPFGRTPDKEQVDRIVIGNDNLRAAIVTWGASIQRLNIAGVPRSLVLGLTNARDYAEYSPHLGAIAGRVANRISNGTFDLDGTTYELPRNENDTTTLHGGPNGTGNKIWQIDQVEPNMAILSLECDDDGFPGKLTVSVRYQIEGTSLRVSIECATDAPTLANLTTHCYFNLDGRDTIDSHFLQTVSSEILETDRQNIPTGNIIDLADTWQDFRANIALHKKVLDHNLCCWETPSLSMRHVATLSAGGISMTVVTDQPGLHIYTGDNIILDDEGVMGLDTRVYGRRAGVCLEPQIWPDAIHHPQFPPVILRPGTVRRQRTAYHFNRTIE